MARCPKCGYKLKIWDVKAECPKCSVNIANYDWERRLEEDSVKAEAAFARLHENMRRFKFSIYGNRLRIARIPVSVLPLFTLLLPLGRLAVSLPFYEATITVNIISIVMNIMKFDIGGIFKFPGSSIAGDAGLMFMLSLLFFLLAVISLPVSLVFLLLNFKKLNSKGLSLTNLAAALLVLGSGFCLDRFISIMESGTVNVLTGGLQWGLFVCAGAFFASAVINMCVANSNQTLPEGFGEKKEAGKAEQKETAAAAVETTVAQ